MKIRKYHYYVGDFETTVYKGQEDTQVWAAALVEFGSEDVRVFHSIDELFEYLVHLQGNQCVYFHNLKFDGSFWLSYLLRREDFGLAAQEPEEMENVNSFEWASQSHMKNGTYKYLISNMGQWYSIMIKTRDKIIEIRDSLKLLPFTVKAIGQGFKTAHQKLEMEYKGLRYPGCEITEKEREYIANDVLVVKEALEVMHAQKHDKITIGSCCLAEFKRTLSRSAYEAYFPDLTEYVLPTDYGASTADAYIRKAYKGGWCYVVPEKREHVFTSGLTLDVNSLYPSVMSSESGSQYPTGLPHFWKGDYIPDEALAPDAYFYVRIKTRFYIRENYLPFIQVKNSLLYKGTECLRSSDIFNREDGEYYDSYRDLDGKIKPAVVELTLSCIDFRLFQEHYELFETEILDGCYFESKIGLFDAYIEKYRHMKETSTGALRQLAKLFLNNLYGKMASSNVSSFKVAYLKDDGALGYYLVEQHTRKAGYIPVGAAITSYARNFTIRAAQLNYYGPDKSGFIYADTDSIHCDLPESDVKGCPIHDTAFCHWKIENKWERGWFVRQKTYIEQVKGKYQITCAGMPERCKELLAASLCLGDRGATKGSFIPPKTIEDEMSNFANTPRRLEDFRSGLVVPGKLYPKNIRGGILLTEGYYALK